MSFVYDVKRAHPPERMNESLLEQRLLSAESKFVQRIVEGMPFPTPPRHARAAEKVAMEMVEGAFRDWFAPFRRVFIDTWTKQGRALAPSIEQSYGTFLEKIALRKGKRVAEEEDLWEPSQKHLDHLLDAGAEAFRCAVQQQDGWVTSYRLLEFEDGDVRSKRREYLRVINVARGFLGVQQVPIHERRELGRAGLGVVRGAIVPQEAGSSRAPERRADGLVSAFETGQRYRQAYEHEVRRYLAEREERMVLAQTVQEVLRTFERDAFLGPDIAETVRRHAHLIIRLEEELRTAQLAREHATTVEARKKADARVEEIQRQRSGTKDSLVKARILLRVYEEAKRLSLVQPEEEARVIRLTDIAKRLES